VTQSIVAAIPEISATLFVLGAASRGIAAGSVNFAAILQTIAPNDPDVAAFSRRDAAFPIQDASLLAHVAPNH
jgi:hypothetical protein